MKINSPAKPQTYIGGEKWLLKPHNNYNSRKTHPLNHRHKGGEKEICGGYLLCMSQTYQYQ